MSPEQITSHFLDRKYITLEGYGPFGKMAQDNYKLVTELKRQLEVALVEQSHYKGCYHDAIQMYQELNHHLNEYYHKDL